MTPSEKEESIREIGRYRRQLAREARLIRLLMLLCPDKEISELKELLKEIKGES